MDALRATSHDSVEEDPRAEQPSIRAATEASEMTPLEPLGPPAANRHRLPDERPAITHHFAVGGHQGYLTVGLYPNGQPGEIFIRMAKEGSTIAGLMECFGTVVSVSLQHGVPLRVLCDKLSHTRFEPSGWTGSAELGYAKSIMDYLFRWLELRFLSGTQLALFSASDNHGSVGADPSRVVPISSQESEAGDAPACRSCGALMSPNGNCYVCRNCGGTSGCSRRIFESMVVAMYSDGDSGSVICFVADSRRSYVQIRAVRLRAMPTNRGSWRQRHTSSDDRYFLKYEALISYPSV